jgi:hypothetical protein
MQAAAVLRVEAMHMSCGMLLDWLQIILQLCKLEVWQCQAGTVLLVSVPVSVLFPALPPLSVNVCQLRSLGLQSLHTCTESRGRAGKNTSKNKECKSGDPGEYDVRNIIIS